MERLDNFLKEKGYFESREKAQKAIKSGNVFIDGKMIKKPSYLCQENSKITIQGKLNKYVSRGAYKLEKALNFFDVEVKGKKAIDIGSSTGGFTDVLLQRNIAEVVCIDVGKGQLHAKIRKNKRVQVFEETDFRSIDPALIYDANIIVIDVSFISTKHFIEKINSTFKDVQIICLIKPQFECGAAIAKKFKGVIKDKNVHLNVLSEAIKNWNEFGFFINNITHSPIVGGDGNIEYLFLISRENKAENLNLKSIVFEAFKNFSSN